MDASPGPATATTPERVVLLDDEGRAAGSAPKAEVHHASTPVHLAFSAYLFSADELLLTRRAASKRTFPGLWTNSVCGHPAPDEPLASAVGRRALLELGVHVESLRLVLPEFRYRAEMDGIVENERCPVFVGTLRRHPQGVPDPREVQETAWVGWSRFADEVLSGRREVSPWCREQVQLLAELGDAPADWPTADPARLPPAARIE